MISKYAPLRDHLLAAPPERLELAVAEIEALVGPLPPSAFRHRAWWANHPNTTAPRNGWLAAGRRIERVDLNSGRITFSAVGAATPTATSSSPRRRASRAGPTIAQLPDPVSLDAHSIESLERFLTFRGASSLLRHRISAIEAATVGLDAGEATAEAARWGLDDEVLRGARFAKRVSAQVDVVLHAAGILRALPYVLAPGERVEYVSLGAGNTGRAHDLETDLQVAEFKFIDWVGGPETVRQDHLLIDVFHLATAATSKRRVMYLTGAAIPERWLQTSTRLTRDCVARKRRLPARFDSAYGPDALPRVRDFWEAVNQQVEIVDLAVLVPELAGFDD